jgi:DNA replicative helicase MCM subunit Mcm2 (Cdc46/Mcm family)
MKVNYRHRPYSTVNEILIKPDRSVVKLWGWVDDIEPPFKDGNDRSEGVFKAKATIRDSEGNSIGTAKFSGKNFQYLIQMHKRAEPVEVLGEVSPYQFKSKKWRNRIYVLSVASGGSPLSRTEPLDRELTIVENYLIPRKANRLQVLDEIREAACENTDTILSSAAYTEAVNFIILQSLSGGFVGKTNGRLHSCVIGTPGGGKGHLVEIIKLLNPIFEESQVERVNDVGLTGTQTNKGGLWGVMPGKLPKANLGIYVVQDFDKCSNKNLIFNIFNSAMEEGKVIVTGAADVTLSVAASIHIDLNRKSDLYVNTIKKGSSGDIELPSNIISRFDYITEFVEDIQDQNTKGRKIIEVRSRTDKKRHSVIAKYCQANGVNIDRFLKILIAYIRTKYEHIDIAPVSDLIVKRYSQLLKENTDIPDLNLYSGRLFTSIQKFVVAASRMQLRKRGNKRAVKMAVRMVKSKLDFLRRSQSTSTTTASPATGKLGFVNWLIDEFGSDSFSPKKAIKRYRKHNDPCGPVADRTLLNWIKYAAGKVKHNHWKIREEIMQQYQ